MQAEIIAIGDEILIGQTLDTNSTFIATQLNLNGVEVRQKRVIADEADSIRLALDTIFPETKVVIMTGGLGPTTDDITKNTLTEYFGGKLEFHQEVYDNIVALFKSFRREPMASNKSQAWLPSSCRVILNEIGTASGMHFEKDGVHYFSCPGVPYEAEHLVENKIIPWIRENLQAGNVYHKTVLTIGAGESHLADKVEAWAEALPEGIKLAYLPSPGMVKIRLSSYKLPPDEAREKIAEQILKLHDLIGPYIYGEDADTIEEVLGKLLLNSQYSISTAESCTGGHLASRFTSIPGSSEYFLGGVVSYCNEAKHKSLGVSWESLEKHGAVSEVVACEMAAGAREKFDSTFALSTTGIAGPAGGTPEQPVGTVWIALAGPHGVHAREYNFGRDRDRNIRRAALMAMDMLRKELQKNKV